MNELSDPGTERSVLSGLCQHGSAAHLDIGSLLSEETFTVPSNQIFFKCCEYVLSENDSDDKDPLERLTQASIISAAASLGMQHFFESTAEFDHMRAIFSFPEPSIPELRQLTNKLYKLEMGRLLVSRLSSAITKVKGITGNESTLDIVSIAEDAIFSMAGELEKQNTVADKVGDHVHDHIAKLQDPTEDPAGISTGFPRYDEAIGGGLAGGSINVIGARSGVGKSMIANRIANNLAIENTIPVLYIDTEMKL